VTKNHVSQESLHELHHKAFGLTAINDGKCLTGHDSKYEEMTCSYRWQAHVVAKERETQLGSTRYNVRGIHTRFLFGIKTNAYTAKSGKPHPSQYIGRISYPHDGDWDLDGPKRLIPRQTFLNQPRDIAPGANFQDCYNPYWHNSHHMIPKSLFNKMIDETGSGEGANPECPAIIRSCLLEAGYNINHKINMIILPQDKEVGEILRLPRHLILLEEGGGEDVDAGLRKEMMSHVEYDTFVKEKLIPEVDAYKKKVAETKCVSPDPKPSLSKEKLEDVSEQCFDAIVRFGLPIGGRPLSDIKDG
jgi:A nuclease family of the HNH/ENDO VII superfamily with conserved AHH